MADHGAQRPPEPVRLLLVEDNEVNRTLTLDILSAAGWRTDVAEHGLQAVEAAATGSYDLILMDIHMPVMDGFEAARRIRKAEPGSGRRVPILALTATEISQAGDRLREAGIDGLLTKPLDPKGLIEDVARRIGPPPVGRGSKPTPPRRPARFAQKSPESAARAIEGLIARLETGGQK